MKKWLLGMMAAVMAVSLAACTPTTEKQKEETTTVSAENPEPAVVPTTGGASDKVPDPNVEPVAVISIYHKGDGDSLVQEMDSLDDDDLNAQALVDRMIGYGVFTEGTEVISFDKTGEEENAKGVLNLNQAKNNEGVTETQFLVEIGNTFIENFELSTPRPSAKCLQRSWGFPIMTRKSQYWPPSTAASMKSLSLIHIYLHARRLRNGISNTAQTYLAPSRLPLRA